MSFLCWRLQSWMQDSRWGLTRAEQRNRITSLVLLAMLLLMQLRIQLAFWAVNVYCQVTLSFSSTGMSKYFFSGLFSIHSSHSLYLFLYLYNFVFIPRKVWELIRLTCLARYWNSVVKTFSFSLYPALYCSQLGKHNKLCELWNYLLG